MAALWNALVAATAAGIVVDPDRIVQDHRLHLHNNKVDRLHRNRSDEDEAAVAGVAADDCSVAVYYVAVENFASVLPGASPSTDCRLHPQKFEVAASTAGVALAPNKEISPVGFLLPCMDHVDAALNTEIDTPVLFPYTEGLVVAAAVAAAAAVEVCTEIVDFAFAEIVDYKEIDEHAAVGNAEHAAAAVVALEMDQAVAAAAASPFDTVTENSHYIVNSYDSASDEISHQSNYQADLHASFVGVVSVKHPSYRYHCHYQHLSSHYYLLHQ